jgi:uncharacterized damage-inducible protein DinB
MRIPALLAALVVSSACAQAPVNPLSSDVKAAWKSVNGFILKSAEKMPEEQYSFQPTPDVRTFGAILGHIADAHYLLCGAEKGEKRELVVEKTKTMKADLIAALQDSIGYCDASYDAMTDARAAEIVKFFGRDRTRLGVLQSNIAHDFEHYGNLVTYLRMKGLVPPSSERRQ